MTRAQILLAAGVALVGAAATAGAQSAPPIPYETFTLDNGLQFIVHEDHSVPIVHVEVWYDVGSAHEPPGRSGFAHLFEHLMFQRTENLELGEFDRLINEAGGSMNATVDKDRSLYYQSLPSNRVNLALWLEADRMQNLIVDEAAFQREREVVKEERRMRIDNAPYGNSILMLDTLSTDWPPYRHTTIGSMEDLDAATAEDARQFYERFYVPNNAAIVVAGDVTVDQVRQLAEEYFAHIPRGPSMEPLPPIPPTPRTDGERRETVASEMATLPLYNSGYSIPPHVHEDSWALALLGRILMSGESSRLNQRLVQQERAALDVGGGPSAGVGPGMFQVLALPNQGVDVSTLEALIEEEIDRVRREGVTERELEKAKNQTRAGTIMGRQSVSAKASQLHHYRMIHGDLGAMNRDLERYMAVTLDDIRRVARTYLVPENRTVVITRPAEPRT